MTIMQDAIARLTRWAGFHVFPAFVPPEVGTVWTPAHGGVLPRTVFSTTSTHVTYGHGDVGATITLASWHRWRTQTKARCGGSNERV